VQTRWNPATVQFSATIFLSAFLLFWTQLILGKFILPWFGGTPAVWTTCMLFFQVLLLAGYAYAHIITKHLNGRAQALTHAAVLLLSVGLLIYLATIWDSPITPGAHWKPLGETDPVPRIISLLAVAVGLPYFALSTTGPLLQAWYQRGYDTETPYRLYAVSNLGSFLALFSFPIVIEPHLPLKLQGRIWSAAYLLFAVGCCVCAFWCVARGRAKISSLPPQPAEADSQTVDPPRLPDYLLWFALAASASVIFLATTNQLCQDVAVVPLLWILPLGIYLLSFILCFEHPRWYVRNWFQAAFALSLSAACFVLLDGAIGSISIQVAVYLAVLFSVCMMCHGELARSKPQARFLTAFYLAVAAGGAFGGIFVGLLAPRLFSGFWEYQIGLFVSAALLLLILSRERGSWLYQNPAPMPVLLLAAAALLPEAVAVAVSPARRVSNHFALFIAAILFLFVFLNGKRSAPEKARNRAVPLCCAAAASVAAVVLAGTAFVHARKALIRYRNFYGTLAVLPREGDVQSAGLSLVHGRVVHGFQLETTLSKRVPTAYYSSESGLGHAFRQVSAMAQAEHRVLRVGAVGLGVGTTAAYSQTGDSFRFYEINPQVIAVASNPAYFSFLTDSPAPIQVVPGDARLSLEREADRGELQDFDVLVLDAFSGDSVPVHLLTREAFAVYLRHLHKPGGILAIHVTNTYLDLRPVVIAAAEHYGLHSAWIHASGDGRISTDSDWMLLSGGELPKSSGDISAIRSVRLWTDDYSNLLQLLRK
jgi:hypothetical protein